MPRSGSVQFALPEFSGTTRRLVLWNLAAFFVFLLASAARVQFLTAIFNRAALRPEMFLAGAFWQPFTYSLVHPGVLGTALELISIWFLCGFLQSLHTERWLMWLYIISVLGSAVTAILLFAIGLATGYPPPIVSIYGCMGGIFGLLVAIGVLHGETQFQLMFVLGVKAKYMAIIYALLAIASAFGEYRLYAFAELGGGLAALLYIRLAPRRGFGFVLSESWYGLRNRYYRWKRRRAASKFQVYMKKQGRTVRFDGQGRPLDEDRDEHNDRKRWN